jgi:predicted PurR-regulated permease PerM
MNAENANPFQRITDGETNQAAAPTTHGWSSRNQINMLVLLAATSIGIYLCYRLAEPFLPALAWALALAVLFIPFHRRLESKFKNPTLAASISILLIALIVVTPSAFVGQRLISEALKGVDTGKTKIEAGEWQRTLEAWPRIAPIANWIERQFDLPGIVKAGAAWLTTTAGSFLKNSVKGTIGLLLTFYLLFYLLRDRRAALRLLRALSPLSEVEMDKLFSRVGDTVYSMIYGTLVVAIAQGALGGLMFWWLGLSTPLLWGVVMSLLAVVPVLGAFVVWIPVALLLALEGSWGKALILAVWGGLVVGGIHNILYPILVGNRLKLHTVFAFIAMVGGLIVFGPSGLILGPVALTVTQLFLEIWRSRTAVALPTATHAKTQPPLTEGKPI